MKQHLPHLIARAASVVPDSVDDEARTVEITWTTGARRRMWSWEDGEVDEELDVSPRSVDLSAFDGGPVLNAHRTGDALDVIGVVVPGSVRIAKGAGTAKVRFLEGDEDAERIWQRVRQGVLRQWSVGYDEIRYERTAPRDRKDGGDVPLYRATYWRPREVSAVPVGADPGALTRSAGPGASVEITDKESEMTTERAPQPAPEADTAQTEAERAAELAQIEAEATRKAFARLSEIETACRVLGFPESRARELAACDKPIDQIRADLLAEAAQKKAAAAPPASSAHVEMGIEAHEKRHATMVASLLRRANPGNETYAKAEGAREYNVGIKAMMRIELEARGVSTRRMSDREIARRVFQRTSPWVPPAQRSGDQHTTGDLSNVFLDAMHKALADRYEMTVKTYREWMRQSNYRDFRDHHHVRLSGLPVPPKKVEGAPYERVRYTDKRNKSSLDTYGFRLDFTRESFVNDDLEAFGQIPEDIADAFAYNEEAIAYGLLTSTDTLVDGYALFNAAQHGNILTSYGAPGATIAAVLAEETYSTVEGKTKRFMYRHVIVPVNYAWTAEQYYLSPWDPTASTGTRPRSAQGKNVIISEQLADGAWYVAEDRSGLVWGYLDGEEGIYTEEQDAWDTDGVSMRARSDFGVGVQDYRRIRKILETEP